MPHLLFEIGTEEIPASYLRPAESWLQKEAKKALGEARLTHDSVATYSTPRRITLVVEGVAERQPDKDEEVTGPKAAVAFDDSGELTKAGLGFLRGRGVDPSAAYKKETKKGEVLAARVFEPGKAADEVLPPLLEHFVAKMPFPKRMRWSDDSYTFPRPIRWLLCRLGDEIINVHIAGLSAGGQTRGHRFMAPDPVHVPNVSAYESTLRESKVLLRFDERRERIKSEAEKLAKSVGGVLREDAGLLDTVANLVEWPVPLIVPFDDKYLRVPQAVLLSEMREHQKYFGVLDDAGKLMPYFIVVAGSETEDLAKVGTGHRRVLLSRFEDGAFYYETDLKVQLTTLREKLGAVRFERKLGTLLEKNVRIEKLTSFLADAVGASPEDKKTAERAAFLCKADLLSGVVGEFPDLQGTMGAHYACKQGESDAVGQAIEEHYAPRTRDDAPAVSLPGALVAMADRLDTVVGILAAGKAPSGSADPFGLRRAAIGLLETALSHDLDIDLAAAVSASVETLGEIVDDADALHREALKFITGRLKGVLEERLSEQGSAADVVDAVLARGGTQPLLASVRARALMHLRTQDAAGFLALAGTFKRVGNIVKKARKDGAQIDAQLAEKYDAPAATALSAAVDACASHFDGDLTEEAPYRAALDALASLRPAVDTFFDEVMVMDDDATVRARRLSLLAKIQTLLDPVADFTRLQDKA